MTEPTTAAAPARKPSHGKTVAIAAATAVICSTCVTLTKTWEGTDLVAKRDMIGTGHPITYCHGQTSEFGAVKVGQRFTPAQCDQKLAESLPKYLTPLLSCITHDAPVKVVGSVLDFAYNGGPTAACHSPMVAHINAGNFTAACNAFRGFYVRASGRIVQGLINRREAERRFCLAGVVEGLPRPVVAPKLSWWQRIIRRIEFWT